MSIVVSGWSEETDDAAGSSGDVDDLAAAAGDVVFLLELMEGGCRCFDVLEE